MNKLVGLIGFGLLVGTPAVGGPLLDKAKEVGGSAVEIVGETASGIGKRVKGEKESPDDARQRIDRMATETIERLIEEAPSSNEQFDNAAGYAVIVDFSGIRAGRGCRSVDGTGRVYEDGDGRCQYRSGHAVLPGGLSVSHSDVVPEFCR